MVRISEQQLQQITQLAKDGATVVEANNSRIANVATPIDPHDVVIKSYVDGYVVSDATETSVGVIRLSGDLSGSAAAPEVIGITGALITGTPGSEEVVVATSPTTAVWKKLTQDDILPGFSINSFSVSGTNFASTVEIGTTISNIIAVASYSATPTSAVIGDSTAAPWAFSSPFTSGSRPGTITYSSNNSWTATLSATYNSTTKTASVTVNWLTRVYHGPAIPSTYNATFITSLASSNLQGSRATTFTDVMNVGQYDYYAIPTGYGTPTFIYGVLPGGWSLVQSGILVTNSKGIQISYDLWKTNQPNLGSTTWTVT